MRLALLLAVAGTLAFGTALRAWLGIELSPAGIQSWVGGLGWKGPICFVALVVFRQFLALPVALVLPVGGLCFGAAGGTVLGAAGIVLSGAMKFAIARAVGRDWIRARYGARFREVEARIERLGPAAVGLVTAYPMGPLSPFHWAAGLSSISLASFLVAVTLGAPVRAFAYSLLGSALVEPTSTRFIAGLGVLVATVVLPVAYRRLRRRAT